jgi:protein required for attachment to host cells
MLRWLKTVVVSDVEKAHEMRQVGTGKTVRSPRDVGAGITGEASKLFRWHQNRADVSGPG